MSGLDLYLEKAQIHLREMTRELRGVDAAARVFAEGALAQFGLALTMLEATLREGGPSPGPPEPEGGYRRARELVRSFLPHARGRLEELHERCADGVPISAQPLFEEVISELAMALDVLLSIHQHLVGGGADPLVGTEIITVLRADGVIEYESAALTDALGYAPAELVGAQAFDLIHPDDRPALREVFDGGLRRPGTAIAVTYRFRHRNGGWRRLQSIARNVVRDSRPVGYVVRSHLSPEHLPPGQLRIRPGASG